MPRGVRGLPSARMERQDSRSVPFGLLVVFSLVVSSVVFSPGQQEDMGFAVLVFVQGPERMGAVLEAAGLVRATRNARLDTRPLSPSGPHLTDTSIWWGLASIVDFVSR